MSKVLVLYYSSYGHIEAMANAVAEGARQAGANAILLCRCCEPIGENYLRELTTHLSYCDHDYYVGHYKKADRMLQRHVSTRNARVS
jgi:multimeric flavodoxin WrbA